MTDRYYEDFKTGERFISGGMTMTEAGIIEFARQWDPQPFHIDVEFAKKWQFGGLIASGLHTMCVTLRLWLDLGIFHTCSLGSPGLGETQFPRPVRPGDTLRVITDIVWASALGSSPTLKVRSIPTYNPSTFSRMTTRSTSGNLPPGTMDLTGRTLAYSSNSCRSATVTER